MAAKLQLASWSGMSHAPSFKADHPHSAKFRALKPACRVAVAKTQAETASYKTLCLVVALHLAAFGLLMPADKVQPIEKPATPMLVSLVSDPQPEPKVTPEPKVEPTPPPVIKKQKSQPKPQPKVVKPAPQPKVEESAPAPQAAAPVPAPVQEPAPAPQQVAKASEVIEKAPPPEVLEHKVEPPKFGAAYLHNPAPAYPALSRRMGEEGRVVLRVLVTTNGEAGAVQVETGSGSERLDKAALESVKKWRFIPAKQNNQPVSAYVLVPVKFSLNS